MNAEKLKEEGTFKKDSKKGRLKLIKSCGTSQTVMEMSFAAANEDNVMRDIFRNGELLATDNFEAIRGRVNKLF